MNIDTTKSLAWPSDLDELEEALGKPAGHRSGWPDNLSIYVRAGVLRALVEQVRGLERELAAERAWAALWSPP